MATAKVTLTVKPEELQVIDEALRMYSFALKRLGYVTHEHPLEHYRLKILSGDNRKESMMAEKIRQDIGLKG